MSVVASPDDVEHDIEIMKIPPLLQKHIGSLAVCQSLIVSLNAFGAFEAQNAVQTMTTLLKERLKEEAQKIRLEGSDGLFKVPNVDSLRSIINENRAGELVESINNLIETDRLKSFWDAIFHFMIDSTSVTSDSSTPLSPEIKRSASVDAVSALAPSEELIYRSEGVASGHFGVNPLDVNQMYVSTLVNILEIDIEHAARSYKVRMV